VKRSVVCLGAGPVLCVALLMGVQIAAAQTLSEKLAGGVQDKGDACSELSGSYAPECQATGTPLDLPSFRQSPAGQQLPSQEGETWADRQSNASVNKEDKSQSSAFVNKEDKSQSSARVQKQEFPLERPSEFQRFVASSVGQLLPIFGASLFENAPTTFAPLDRVPVTADYVIGPGDEILLRVWGQQSLNLKLTVDRAGAVYIPQVGNVSVAGIQFKQLPDYLRAQLERVFRNFDLSVNMGQLRSIQVYVMGNARVPGLYTVSSLSTLVNALFSSGGPSPRGSMRRIQLKRGAQVAAELDLYDLLLRGDKSRDIRLLPEDVVYIPPVGAQVAVAGSLKNPAIYELKDEKTVRELIQMTGGFTAVADRQRARLERIKDGASREILEVALNESGMNIPVADGDVLQVLAIMPRFDNTVTLRGNVANPGRFSWHSGMRLRDIIPEKDTLITRDYWKKRNLLGYISPENSMASDPKSEAARKPAATSVQSVIAVIERQDSQTLTAKLMPFNLGKLILENDESQNLELHSGDVVTIFSQADIQVPQLQQRRTVRLEGEFNAPGIYTVSPGETLGQIIQKAGGITPQAYLFGAEFMRESTRLNQQSRMEKYIKDLEQEAEKESRNRLANASSSEESTKLAEEIKNQQQAVQRLRMVQATGRIVLSLQPDSNDLSGIAGMTLEDGDRFVIPARPSTINVMGEVYNPNSFIHVANRQVKNYLELSGGFTRDADEGRSYIIRADGSVLPKQNTSKFSKLELNPGDTIVVPEHLFKTTFLTGLRNWSQVISQFGLGAAAINVLR